MGMRMQFIFMLGGVLVLCNLLSGHGSADDDSFPAASPLTISVQRHRKPLVSHSNRPLHFPAFLHAPPTEAPFLPKVIKPSSISVAPSVSSFTDDASFPAASPITMSAQRHRKPLGSHSNRPLHFPAFMHEPPTKAPTLPKVMKPSSISVAPSVSSFRGPVKKWIHGYAHAPSVSSHKHHHHVRNHFSDSAPQHSLFPQHIYHRAGPSISPVQSPFPTNRRSHLPAPAPSPTILLSQSNEPTLPPEFSPFGSAEKMKTPPPRPLLTLPPPPPNEDCASITCTDPLTYPPPGTPCGCVWPIQVKLRLAVALYTFFPLVTELAKEIAASLSLDHSQVRIMGANSASPQLEKTTVLINLVPRGAKFGNDSAFAIYTKFFHKQVQMEASQFGDYEVLYVHYPGLPPSPPSSIITTDSSPYTDNEDKGPVTKPLGVNVPKRKRDGPSRSTIAVLVLSSFMVLIVCTVITWILLRKCEARHHQSEKSPRPLSPAKPSGSAKPVIQRSLSNSASTSLHSNGILYAGSAKTFSSNDIERFTNNFDSSQVLGEGGFGIVYRGILDDGEEVAVKVLKRDDHHGSREFLSEVEMLSRLHHRNLVILIGICMEEHIRCVVYELIPNGSVDSHLHGCDKENNPLDWGARMKIALGAARGLAYLHEDSSPHVIHRDFKSSNILLEPDFTPRVSDFGLARAALDEGNNRQVSTHVMGTFGYLAPEYAMTGHLLVKSDVYSYGVVLLELLTGRKPVDLSQPPGQENLVSWARALLTDKEALQTIIDPSVRSSMSFDSVAKVAAIASMCVQPEASHRPFMGEVVQALKLVINEFDETKELSLGSCIGQESSTCVDGKVSKLPHEFVEALLTGDSTPTKDSNHLEQTGCFRASTGIEDKETGYSPRHCSSSSGPLRVGKRRQFWQRLRSLSRGSFSEHEFALKLWPDTF
ncbi:receptor-like serine/threonine-protein kinase ALE2 isoform X2 [Syzygium oleosum]|uniref:receptor-like serine/threonine-protein kinase ALE2 isoform X2 n=1 Tax=Syzygium oleosum TaxID=219896 RepID=UPI0011D21124|nr:receptor-like serine/threonine-protein kinase ALE2 isoform X2 [Syzygium oleosum]